MPSPKTLHKDWEVIDVAVLRGLFLTVVESKGSPPRTIDLRGKEGSGLLTRSGKAALVALVVAGSAGLGDEELSRAIRRQDGAPTGQALADANYAVITGVRKINVTIKRRDERYFLDLPDPTSLDAPAFRRLYERVDNLARSASRRENRDRWREETMALTRQALHIWNGSPHDLSTTHSYLRDKSALSSFATRFVALCKLAVEALLESPTQDDMNEANQILALVRERHPQPPWLDEFERLFGQRSLESPVAHRPTAQTVETHHVSANQWLELYLADLAHRIKEIDLRGFGSKVMRTSTLDQLYTDLFAAPGPSEMTEEGERHALDEVVDATPRALLIGESGAGKSTFLLHLCHRSLSEGNPLPLLVELVELNDLTEEDLSRRGGLPADILVRAFCDQVKRRGITVAPDQVQNLANSGQVRWILDGLNEITSPAVRTAVWDAACGDAHRWPKALYAVTTTPSPETDKLPTGQRGFVSIAVDGLRSDDVERLLDCVTHAARPAMTSEERRGVWEPLASRIAKSRELRALARLPLYLTAIALTWLEKRRLDESRASILAAATNWLFEHQHGMLKHLLSAGTSIDKAYSLLAFTMVSDDAGPLSTIGRRRAANLLAEAGQFSSRESAAAFLAAATLPGGLLQNRGIDIGIDDAFRNYLACQWLADMSDEETTGWWSVIRDRIDDTRWADVLRLLPGCLLAEGRDRVDSFLNRIAKADASQSFETRSARMALGGGVLHELAGHGYQAPQMGQWKEAVFAVAQRLFAEPLPQIPIRVRFNAAIALGLTHDARFDDFEATLAWLEGGVFWLGAQAVDERGRNYDAMAAPWEEPVQRHRLGAFAIRRYPITVVEFAAFVDADGYGDRDCWDEEGWGWVCEAEIAEPLQWDVQLLAPNTPVTGVSWYEASAFCRWLTSIRSDDFTYRLPSEWEWERAARSGTGPKRVFPWGWTMSAGDEAECNWAGTYLRTKSPVGLFPRASTPERLADLFGNVEEWCLETWDSGKDGDYAELAGITRPRTPPTTSRVVRGGSTIRASRLCRPSYRSRIYVSARYQTVGFRLVADPQFRSNANG